MGVAIFLLRGEMKCPISATGAEYLLEVSFLGGVVGSNSATGAERLIGVVLLDEGVDLLSVSLSESKSVARVSFRCFLGVMEAAIFILRAMVGPISATGGVRLARVTLLDEVVGSISMTAAGRLAKAIFCWADIGAYSSLISGRFQRTFGIPRPNGDHS